MSPFELSSCCSCHIFSYFFAQFLTLKWVKCPPFFKFTTKTTQPRPQVFLANGSLTCKNAAFFGRHFLAEHKILPNLVISNWLWWITAVATNMCPWRVFSVCLNLSFRGCHSTVSMVFHTLWQRGFPHHWMNTEWSVKTYKNDDGFLNHFS